MNCLLCLIALSAVSNATWTSAARQSSLSGVSSFTPRASFSKIKTFDFTDSLGTLIQRQRSRGRAKWTGWMATDWLRLRVAPLGGASAGGEIGATAILFQSWLSPTITTEAGHSSGRGAFTRFRVLTKSPYLDPALIRGFTYDYQATYVGLELGARSFAISVNLGLIRAENRYQSGDATAFNTISGIQNIRSAQIGPAGKLALLMRL
jgi:hypothetical protein